MEHLDHVDQTVSSETAKPSQQARAEKKTGAVSSVSTIKESAEPNRGHGNENLKPDPDNPAVLAVDGEHKIARSPSGEIITIHKSCAVCNKLLMTYMKEQKSKKGKSSDAAPSSTTQAEETQPEKG